MIFHANRCQTELLNGDYYFLLRYVWTRVLTDARTYSSILIQAMIGLCQDKDYFQDISKTVLNRSQFWCRVKNFQQL